MEPEARATLGGPSRLARAASPWERSGFFPVGCVGRGRSAGRREFCAASLRALVGGALSTRSKRLHRLDDEFLVDLAGRPRTVEQLAQARAQEALRHFDCRRLIATTVADHSAAI